MEVGDRVIEGDLQERQQARQTYNAAIQAGHRAAIAEEERPDVFTMRVGNLPPGEEITIYLDLAGPLDLSAGDATYRFPLVVAPRYIPGRRIDGEQVGDGVALDTDQVPDASRISPPTLLPGHSNPVQLSLSLEFDRSGIEASNLRSTIHMDLTKGCDPETGKPNGVLRGLKINPGHRLDQDFVFRFSFQNKDLQSTLTLEDDGDGSGEGTFMLTVVPPDQQGYLAPRDVIFVLDRSGSMNGWKMVAARRACADLIDSLRVEDRFGVLAFDTAIESVPGLEQLAEATSHNRFVATRWLSNVHARGGTEIRRPLDQAVGQLAGASVERERTIVLITDGQIGNEQGVLHQIVPKLNGTRVFTLGIDRAVNAGFLNSLASSGGGRCELVENEERLNEALDGFKRTIGKPFLEDVDFTLAGLDAREESVTPASPRHLFCGVPLLIMGRYSQASERPTASIPGIVPVIDGRRTGSGAVSVAWARGRIRNLEDRLATGTGYGAASIDRAGLEAKVVALSLQHKVLSRYTAYVAVDKAEVVNAGGEVHKATQPVELPAGWEQQTSGGIRCVPIPNVGGIIMGQQLQSFSAGLGGGGGGTTCSAGGLGNYGGSSYQVSSFLSAGGPPGPSGPAGPAGAGGQGVSAGFRGFAPGFDPNARRSSRSVDKKMSRQLGSKRSRKRRKKADPETVEKAFKLLEWLILWKTGFGGDAGELKKKLNELVVLLEVLPVDRGQVGKIKAFAQQGRHNQELVLLLQSVKLRLEAVPASRRDGKFWEQGSTP